VDRARPKFLKGEYSSSVSEACKALEGLVRKKSGIEDSGTGLMGKAFGDDGALAVSLPGLTGETRGSVRRGIMHMCMGIMSSVRNPISHEPEIDFPMTRDDALDVLGVIGYLCRQVERTRRRPRQALPKGGRRDPGKPAAGAARSPQGGGNATNRAGAGPAAELSVSPESVERGGRIDVTVTGMGIDGWYVSVLSEEGRVKSPATRLEAYGLAARNAAGEGIYSFPINTLGYAPEEHRVCVSSDKGMEARGMRIKKFTVTNYLEMQEADDVLAESEEVKYAMEGLEARIDDLERRESLHHPGVHTVDALEGMRRMRGQTTIEGGKVKTGD